MRRVFPEILSGKKYLIDRHDFLVVSSSVVAIMEVCVDKDVPKD